MLANTVDVQAVLQRSKLGFITWNNNTPVERQHFLYAVARHVQKHAGLIGSVEALDSTRLSREVRSNDPALLARALYVASSASNQENE
ncbi:MAG: hypothetical protein EZS28_054818, partial [Streblomastix strix]